MQGIDYATNIALPDVDFGTVHLYPGNWLLAPNEYHWLIPNFLADRAGIALAAGKPIILEARPLPLFCLCGGRPPAHVLGPGLGGACCTSPWLLEHSSRARPRLCLCGCMLR